MKKVKITVLKTTLDQELAEEYGAEGLTACPMLTAGQVFYADYAKPDGFCDEAWKCLLLRTVRATVISIMATGSESRVWRSVAATTAFAPLYSSWKRRMNHPR